MTYSFSRFISRLDRARLALSFYFIILNMLVIVVLSLLPVFSFYPSNSCLLRHFIPV